MTDLARWPLLTGAATLAALGIGLDLAEEAAVAYAVWTLAAACVGAFLYAEGARHREWWHADDTPTPRDDAAARVSSDTTEQERDATRHRPPGR